MNWSVARDFDFYIASLDSEYVSRNRDAMSAPGGEYYTVNTNHGPNDKFIAYSYFFSNEMFMSSAQPYLTFYANDNIVYTLYYNATQTDMTYRYWVAACFDGLMNVTPLNYDSTVAPSVSLCY